MNNPRLALIVLAFPAALLASVPARTVAPAVPSDRIAVHTRQAEEDYSRARQFADSPGAQDYTKAAALYLKAAEAGYAPAQNELANLYSQGLGLECDPQQAARWYRRAAEQGFAEAQNNLGALYSTGKGVPRNDHEALRWYALAAEQKDPEAISNLGALYLHGRGVDADKVRAFQFFRQAALLGYAGAQNNLALMYANGFGVAQDYVWAWAWLDVAAEQLKASADLRDKVAKEMTEDQLARACERAAETRRKLTATASGAGPASGGGHEGTEGQ